MYDFVQARKNLFLNPFDYLSQQELGNTLKNLLQTNKELISALDVYKLSLDEEDSDSDDGKVLFCHLSSSSSLWMGIELIHFRNQLALFLPHLLLLVQVQPHDLFSLQCLQLTLSSIKLFKTANMILLVCDLSISKPLFNNGWMGERDGEMNDMGWYWIFCDWFFFTRN